MIRNVKCARNNLVGNKCTENKSYENFPTDCNITEEGNTFKA